MAGSRVRALGGAERASVAPRTSMAETNWQFSKKVVNENKLRVFIKHYQSSPLELVVSALNEKLKGVNTKDGKSKSGDVTGMSAMDIDL